MNKELLAPCGLYCGVCGIYLASRDNNQKLKEKLAGAYGVTPEQVACSGCLSDNRFGYCQTCGIRTCVTDKKIDGCHQCDDFPCRLIEAFPVPVGKKVILRAVPERKKLGDEQWVAAEEKRYHCPHCGEQLFRGARRCGKCKEAVEVD
ncbi:MAG: DUF3795 domain-containing protein [Deltaproteobacteria bacterium]|nr:DUF3795 domain-containing protein [Candidatus Anaeroferrophillus wilburensis]MBN2888223.1 DUF3795 domain-containing protein [Deltaproteobacteria bacterium]